MIILLFPSSMRISKQSIVNQNYFENKALVSTVNFRVQSAVSWERSINRCKLHTYTCIATFPKKKTIEKILKKFFNLLLLEKH